MGSEVAQVWDKPRHRARRDLAAQLGPGKIVATMLCDTGERYLSVSF